MTDITSTTQPACFILDVDGVMTTGHFFYSAEGKVMKIFGPDDNDGLSLLKTSIDIRFITGDKKGFPISKKRIVEDMNYELDIVSTIRRVDWIKERYPARKRHLHGRWNFRPLCYACGWVRNCTSQCRQTRQAKR